MEQQNQHRNNQHSPANAPKQWRAGRQKNKNRNQQQQYHNQFHNFNQQSRYHDVKTYLSWQAPGRPFKERSREYFINAFLIMAAVEIILFLFSQYLLMMVVFSLVFLAFALASVPPRIFDYKITSEGILVDKTFFIWEELYDFYFFKHHGKDALHVTTKSYFPGELTLSLGDISTQQIKTALLPFLPYREYVEPTSLEKAGNWLEHNFPLERTVR